MEDDMMRRYYQIILFMVFIILIPNKVSALCDNNAKARLKSITANVTFATKYVESNNSVNFYITLANLHPEIYIKDATSFKYYYYNSKATNPHELTISGYLPGRSIKYEFYTKNVGCTGEVLLVRYVTLPPYNRFYSDPLCQGIEDYTFCQKWIKTNLSYNQFKQKIAIYKSNGETEPPVQEEFNEPPIFISLVEKLWRQYYVYILATTIVACIAYIYQYKRRDMFDLS